MREFYALLKLLKKLLKVFKTRMVRAYRLQFRHKFVAE